ncbi:MAG: metal-dependent transcriptional regulator [Saprospiraceae bacterium]|nr:metal-dependent transcriptional regulator [Saprospiraceae bacterium]
MHLTVSEENYLKAIFKLSQSGARRISTNAIAKEMETAAASVTDMIQRLAEKGLVDYQRYKGSKLSPAGHRQATRLVRKHRLWEVFLHDVLNFGWDEIHDIAEQLEHVKSNELTDRLDRFLGFPKFDPHGDPIPNANGSFTLRNQTELSKLKVGQKGVIVGVKQHEPDFLKLLENQNLLLGNTISVRAIHEFDLSMDIDIESGSTTSVSRHVTRNLFIKPII